MELRQLEYFVAVADEANFTRAAAKVHVSQPGVSAQIRCLERELGQDLFDRSGRAVRLTEAGAAVLPHARAALAAAADAQLAVDELTGLMRGHVTIGTITLISAKDIDLAKLLAGFHSDHPAVEISLGVANTDDLIEALLAGRLDMALVSLGARPPLGIETQVVTCEPLATKTTITLKALATAR